MAAPQPSPPPSPVAVDPRLLTVSEYLELGETEYGYSEPVEGRVVLTPNQVADHQHVAAELRSQLTPSLTSGVEALYGVDIDLELARRTNRDSPAVRT